MSGNRRPLHADYQRRLDTPATFLVLDEEPWMAEGLCAQTDPEAFFPEKGGSSLDAKRICGTCTVPEQCLTYALEHQERFGVWGGLSERERRKYAKTHDPALLAPKPPRRRALTPTNARLEDLGLTSARVRTWARDTNHPAYTLRGRISAALLDAYLKDRHGAAS